MAIPCGNASRIIALLLHERQLNARGSELKVRETFSPSYSRHAASAGLIALRAVTSSEILSIARGTRFHPKIKRFNKS